MTLRVIYIKKRWVQGTFSSTVLSDLLFDFANFEPEYKVVIVVKGL